MINNQIASVITSFDCQHAHRVQPRQLECWFDHDPLVLLVNHSTCHCLHWLISDGYSLTIWKKLVKQFGIQLNTIRLGKVQFSANKFELNVTIWPLSFCDKQPIIHVPIPCQRPVSVCDDPRIVELLIIKFAGYFVVCIKTTVFVGDDRVICSSWRT